MSVQKSALTIHQAVTILETLSLLNTAQHKDSKLVIYDTKIELEPDASVARTVSSATAYASSTLWYYAGYPADAGIRDVAEIVPLMERVHSAFVDQDFSPNDVRETHHRFEIAQNAEKGLTALVGRKYLTDTVKAGHLETAQATIRKIVTYYKDLGGGDEAKLTTEQLLQRQLQTLGRTNSEQTREITTLGLRVADKQQTIDLQTREIEELKLECNRLKGVVVQEALGAPIDPATISSDVLVGRISALFEVLSKRQHK